MELVEVRGSWPGHHSHPKKKKQNSNSRFLNLKIELERLLKLKKPHGDKIKMFMVKRRGHEY